MANQFKTLPKRPELEFKYTDDKDRKMVSLRLPEALIEEIEEVAKAKGWNKTDVIQYAVDQFVHAERKRK
ncbi:MAG: ribbon-helix-helix domain-containing protein [Bdellovibrionales bacterium]